MVAEPLECGTLGLVTLEFRDGEVLGLEYIFPLCGFETFGL